MTLKLVAPDNVAELPVYNFQDIAGCARRFADQVEAKEQGDVQRVIALIQTEDGIGIAVWGDITNSGYELAGMLEAAKLRAFDDDDE